MNVRVSKRVNDQAHEHCEYYLVGYPDIQDSHHLERGRASADPRVFAGVAAVPSFEPGTWGSFS